MAGAEKANFFRAGTLFPANVPGFYQIPSFVVEREGFGDSQCALCVNSRYRSIMCSVSNNGFRFRCELLKLQRAVLYYKYRFDAALLQRNFSIRDRYSHCHNPTSDFYVTILIEIKLKVINSLYYRQFKQISSLISTNCERQAVSHCYCGNPTSDIYVTVPIEIKLKVISSLYYRRLKQNSPLISTNCERRAVSWGRPEMAGKSWRTTRKVEREFSNDNCFLAIKGRRSAKKPKVCGMAATE